MEQNKNPKAHLNTNVCTFSVRSLSGPWAAFGYWQTYPTYFLKIKQLCMKRVPFSDETTTFGVNECQLKV